MLVRFRKSLLATATFMSLVAPAWSASAAAPLVSGAVDDAARVTLAGSRALATTAATDAGAVAPSIALPHVMLVLKRPATQQAALDSLVAAQQQRGNPQYHKWLRAADLQKYGPASADIAKVTAWLTSHGLVVNEVAPSGMSIDVGGSAAQFGEAFGVSLHNYLKDGQTHLATTQDATIPAALSPVVAGVTLSNFFPRPQAVAAAPSFTIPLGKGNVPSTAVTPFDFNTIYNVNPLLTSQNGFGVPITGAAVTIAVVEQTNILTGDWNKFRSTFGLSGYSGQLRPLHPGNCGNPGRTADEVEAAIDAEWAGAAAPDADIVEASCPATATTFGVETTLQKLVETTATNATIYSISYGGCEQENGLPFLQGWANLVEEGTAEGITIVISSGDSGSSCDRNVIDANGLGVNGLASNPYVTSVGGTDFYDTALGKTHQYWTNQNTGFGKSSALSYVPEIPWDNSCANAIVAKVQANTTGIAYCNEAAAGPLQNGVGGTGGASLYYPKPSYQSTSLPGMPKDGVRDQPDVSLFAANGIWNHAYLICMSDANEGGAPCEYHGVSASGTPNALNQAYGGTSVAAPAFAGMLALETQVTGAPLGNVNPRAL